MLNQALVDTAVVQDHYEAHDRKKNSINAEDGTMVQNLKSVR